MHSDTDLFRDLDDEPDTPSTVDIGRAMAAGRKRRTHRRAGYAGAAAGTALAVAGVAVAGQFAGGEPAPPTKAATAEPAYTIPGTKTKVAPATPPTSCELDRLEPPDNAPMALVSGADTAARHIVGRGYPADGGYQAAIWTDGKARKVPLPGDLEESLRDVNSNGTAVGWSWEKLQGDAEAASVPYAYDKGKVFRLAGVKHGAATAINDAGAIVGEDNDGGAPVVWPSATAKPFRLPLPKDAKRGKAHDIGADGTVVGELDMSRPYVWFADGTHRELPRPAVDGETAAVVAAFDVRGDWVSGVARPEQVGVKDKAKDKDESTGKARMSAVRWNLRTGDVQVVGALSRPADDINAQGWQIGSDDDGYAVLVTEAGPVRLPGLGKHSPDGVATIATTLSDDGRTIAGQSDNPDGVIQAVLWHCK